MPKYSNEKLYNIYKEDVSDVIQIILSKLNKLFALDVGLTDDDYDNFLKYWNERIEKEDKLEVENAMPIQP
ncbi:MAG TPA: hypothetical protein VIK78_14660 [Ruminiclostridium sp.]